MERVEGGVPIRNGREPAAIPDKGSGGLRVRAVQLSG
jgi:hypothetical protein